MIAEHTHISKGYYRYSQIHPFVSVTNYIFLHQENKKCLLLRFSNDLRDTVRAMSFTLLQKDTAGRVVEKHEMTYRGLSFAPGSNYAMEQGIVVRDSCNDFEVQMHWVDSGAYRYTARNGKIVVTYVGTMEERMAAPSKQSEPKSKSKTENSWDDNTSLWDDDSEREADEQEEEIEEASEVTVRAKTYGNVGKTVWLCLLAMLLALVLNGWHMISAYLRATEPPELEEELTSQSGSQITDSTQGTVEIVTNQDVTTYQEYNVNGENGVQYYYYEQK